MKTIVNNQDFKKALETVLKVTPSKSALPILECIQAKTMGDKLELTSMDLNIFIKASILSTNQEVGGVIIENPKNVTKAAKFFKDDIVIESGSSSILISSGNKNVKLNNKYNVSEFPNTPEMTECQEYTTTQSKLYDRITKVEDAVGKEEARLIITGYHFKNNDIVTCDGYRVHLSNDNEMKVDHPFTVDGNCIDLVKKVINKKSNEQIKIKVNDKYIAFIMNDGDCNIEIIGRLLDGDYLKYEDTFLKEHDIEIIVNNKEITEAIDYLKAVKGKKGLIKLHITDNKIDATMDVNKTEKGKIIYLGIYNTEINAETKYSRGEIDLTIGFNIDYLADAIKQVSDDNIKMYFVNNNTRPAEIYTENERFLVLPVRLPD